MWEIILAFPVMVFSAIIQVTVFGKIHLLNGSADIILLIIIAWSLHENTRYSIVWTMVGALVMTYLSAMPMYGYMFIYFIMWLFIQFLKKRVWQMPVILMLFLSMFGSFFEAFMTFAILKFQGTSIPLDTALVQVVIPSLIMNMILAVPVYGIFTDIANTIYYREYDL